MVLAGNNVIYPALQALPTGNAAMVVHGHRLGSLPERGVRGARRGGSPRSGRSRSPPMGSGPYDPRRRRWGDYSWAVIDPSGNSVWLATEYMPPLSSQTPTASRTGGRASSRGRRVTQPSPRPPHGEALEPRIVRRVVGISISAGGPVRRCRGRDRASDGLGRAGLPSRRGRCRGRGRRLVCGELLRQKLLPRPAGWSARMSPGAGR